MEDNKKDNGNQDLIWEHFQNDGVEAFSGSRPRIKYIVDQINPDSKLLNIGVGGAILEDLALSRGIDVCSLDPSETAIEKLRNQYDMGEKAKVGYSDKIEFDDDMFDVVVMSEVLEHLNEKEFDRTVKNVMRVLKSSGKFVITVPFEEILFNNEVICPHCEKKFHRWGHQQSFTVNKLKQLLKNNNFEIKQANIRCFPDWSRKGLANFIKSCVRYILGRLGAGVAQPNIFLIAVKNNLT